MAVEIHTDRNGVAVFAEGDPSLPKWGHEYTVGPSYRVLADLRFQWGGVAKHGINGLTNEAVLAVLIHRIGVLNEKFPCEQNELAIGNLRTALAVLESRTADRVKRGVEGKEEA